MRTQVLERVDGMDTRHCARNGFVDRMQRGVRKRASDEGGRKRTGQPDVVDEPRASREQVGIFEAKHACI